MSEFSFLCLIHCWYNFDINIILSKRMPLSTSSVLALFNWNVYRNVVKFSDKSLEERSKLILVHCILNSWRILFGFQRYILCNSMWFLFLMPLEFIYSVSVKLEGIWYINIQVLVRYTLCTDWIVVDWRMYRLNNSIVVGLALMNG